MEENELTLDRISGMLHAASLAKSRIDELELTAQRDHERIDHFLAEATAVDRKTIADITAQVEQYWLRRIAENPGGKRSVKLPWGTIAAREQEPEYIKDDELLAEWAREQGYIREKTTESVDWKSIKEDWLKQGRDVPGVEVVERAPSVTVTVD